MSSSAYQQILISVNQAEIILQELYGIIGEVEVLPGEFDMNFKIKSDSSS